MPSSSVFVSVDLDVSFVPFCVRPSSYKKRKKKMGVRRIISFTSLIIALLAAALASVSFGVRRTALPPHLLGHPVVDRENFLDATTMAELRQMTRDFHSIPSVLRDTDSYKVKRNHIGEAVPYDAINKRCPSDKPFLMTDGKKEKCIFPSRIDVGRHFITTGGPDGVKEDFDLLASRAQPFIKYIFNYTELPVAKRLLESDEFKRFAVSVCPADKQLLDQFQFNVIVQVPGQATGTHIDAPIFYHANRFEFPQWLLAAMVFSNLFADEFVHQVQVVAYYHTWTEAPGGNFIFWTANDAGHISRPISGSANVVDGSKVAHAAGIYRPARRPPPMPRTGASELVFDNTTDKWHVVVDGAVAATYDESELRLGAVYRARCFAGDEDRARFQEAQQNQWSIDFVLSTFKADMIRRGVLKQERAAAIAPYDLGALIMDTYITYPLPQEAAIPFNYCALGKLAPLSKPLLDLFCDH
jgi:hypothetical protein